MKDFIDRLLKVVNQIRILDEDLLNKSVVKKVLVCLLKNFEAKISSLKEFKDWSQISQCEFINALQTTKQKRSIRQEESTESALLSKHKGKVASPYTLKKQAAKREEQGKTSEGSNKDGAKKKFGPCYHCKKGHITKFY